MEFIRIQAMREREKIVVSGLVVLMLITWLGFIIHQSPRFAGSLLGGILGCTGSLLMMVPFVYMVIKRIPYLRIRIVKRIPMRTLLAWHIYAGVIGPILVLLHTGHKFESALGIALTGMTLIVVVSGFIGRYLMSFFSQEIREKKELLKNLRDEYEAFRKQLQENSVVAEQVGLLQNFKSRFVTWAFSWGQGSSQNVSPSIRVMRLTEAIADLEYAIISHENIKRIFGIWLKCHIVISLVLYLLLGLHIWAGIYFGLRWFL